MNSLRVLVVDDSPITLKKLCKMLEDIGHTIAGTARTGRDAIDQYNVLQPELVTMDITMPDMDGIEATQCILQHSPKALIIMVTSHGQEQMVIDAIDSGAKGYVLKPVGEDKLSEMIQKVFERYGSS
ncbi:MAG: response regulator [Gammaproteobacteria bacterium]|nr:response regulator [Gammaproteobacteria bacterium]MDQ7075745.1 response regulator [Gammaproteobacteria bacterium]